MKEFQHSSQLSNPEFSSGPSPINRVYNLGIMNANIDPSLGLDLDYASSDGLKQMLNLSSGVGEFGSFLGDAFFNGTSHSIIQPGSNFDRL